MNFLKKNLFYVVLLGAAAVVGTVLLVIWSSFDTSNEDSIRGPRGGLAGKIAQLASNGSPANEEIIKKEEERVNEYRKMAAEVAATGLAFNRSDYTKQMLPYGSDDGRPLFPFDPGVYGTKGAFSLINAYYARLEELQKKAMAVVPPTDKELDAEKEHQQAVINQAAGVAAPAAGGVGVPGGGVAPPPAAGRDLPGGMGVIPPRGGAVVPIAGAGNANLAQQNALAVVRVGRSMLGRIYIPPGAIDVVWPLPAVVQTTPDKMWDAQVQVWVLNDVLSAINETTEQHQLRMNKTGKDQVANSAVKVLEKFRVNPVYVGGTAASAGGGPAAAPGVTPMAPPAGFGAPGRGFIPGLPSDMWPGGMGPGGMGPGGMGPGGMGAPPGAAPGGPAVAEDPNASLGERTTNTDMDVIRYSFTVIMPDRHVGALMRNLMARNFHTILSIEKGEYVEGKDYYYFGVDPVVRVTFEGQLLMLPAWTRGTAETDKDGKKTWKSLLQTGAAKLRCEIP